MTFGRFIMFVSAGVAGATFTYYFVKSGFNLHKTEIAISRKLAQLPFYWPPGPGEAEVNTEMPTVELAPGVLEQASAWFIYQDTAFKEGVRRNHVLDLFGELGLVDPEKEGDTTFQSVGDEEFRKGVSKLVESFIERGKGRLMEYKRQSGVSLQETIKLLNDLIGMHSTINPTITESVNNKLNDILGKLVESQMATPGMALMRQSGEALPDVDASDKDMLEMELSQLERQRSDLTQKSQLSDAESARLVDIDAQIKEFRALLQHASN